LAVGDVHHGGVNNNFQSSKVSIIDIKYLSIKQVPIVNSN